MARADRVVRRRFVVNRVTAAAMEPRGAIGDYNPADGRYTIYTTLQRTHAYRADLAQIIGVPESRVRVVAGDIGGSFGMKSAIYNEVALVLLASKLARPPGQMDQHPLRGVPVRRAGARPRHRGRAGARPRRQFPRLPHQHDRRDRRLCAAELERVRDESRHPRRGLPHAGDARRGDRGLHEHQPGAALSRQRQARIRLCHRAHGRRGRGRDSASTRSNCAAATRSRPRRCRSRPG